MPVNIKILLNKYKEPLSYILWGVATTAVNYGAYFLLSQGLHVHYLVSNTMAWVIAVIFAYIVNKCFVFSSKSWSFRTVAAEAGKFAGSRLASGVLETFLLFLFVDILHLPDEPVKLAAGIMVILANYITGKFYVFKKQ